jgi:hypothetical protein
MLQGLMGRAVAVAAVVMLASPVVAKDGRVDKLEDRIDLAENAIDESTDHGWRDVAEDKVDAREDQADANGVDKYNAIDRHERRTWRRILRNN